MEGKENQRVMLTKRLIKESLIRMLSRESIYKLSVRELCEDAGINRSTFYKHYGSQYDVLTEWETEFLGRIQKGLEAAAQNPAQQIKTICAYMEANADLVRLLTNNNVDPDFPGKLFNLPMIRQMLSERLGVRYDDESLEYAFTFAINGGYFLIQDWISRDDRKPAEELAALLLELEDRVCR